MNKNKFKIALAVLAFFCLLPLGVLILPAMQVEAKGPDTIKDGIYAGAISLSGLTEREAKEAIENYILELKGVTITLVAADNHEVNVTAEDLGLSWSNQEIVEEALMLGRQGNIIQRYKALKDLAHENKIYPIEVDFEIGLINDMLINKCVRYDQPAINVSLAKENGIFSVVEGQKGFALDVETSIDIVYSYLINEWNHEPVTIALEIGVTEPRGSAEELAMVKDIIGGFSTSYSTSGSSRRANVENGARLINGTTLYPEEEFSAYEAVAPFSEANGYYMAGSYLNGKVVDSLGGGICQVSTTLYNAVLLAELDVTMRYNHSMIVAYVDPSADAAIAESSGKDFKFVNNTGYPIYIEAYTTKDKQLTFNIYGVETRPASRTVEYVSEVLEVTNPDTELIYSSSSQPLGYIAVESAHIGYKAQLWKVVKENGVEISKTKVNSSTYKVAPRSATVGVATSDPNAYNEIMAAIGTNSIDHVKNVIAILTTAPPADVSTPAEE